MANDTPSPERLEEDFSAAVRATRFALLNAIRHLCKQQHLLTSEGIFHLSQAFVSTMAGLRRPYQPPITRPSRVGEDL